jgi:hypothetical protein
MAAAPKTVNRNIPANTLNLMTRMASGYPARQYPFAQDTVIEPA